MHQARFARPSGVASTSDGAAYVSDSASCRLRRVAPTLSVTAAAASCNTTLLELLRPSGCSSYEPPQGGDGLTASPLSGNVWYNPGGNSTSPSLPGRGEGSPARASAGAAAVASVVAAANNAEDGRSVAGRTIRQCQGSPPPARLDRAGNPRDALVVDDGLTDAPEDTGRGTTVRFSCPTSCARAGEGYGGAVWGGPSFYSDDSAVCPAVMHAGLLGGLDDRGGRAVLVARLLSGNASSEAREGSRRNNVTAGGVSGDWARGFALGLASPAEVTAQTVSGVPAGALGEGCGGIRDGQPPQEAVFGRPAGIDAWRWGNLTNEVRRPGRRGAGLRRGAGSPASFFAFSSSTGVSRRSLHRPFHRGRIPMARG